MYVYLMSLITNGLILDDNKDDSSNVVLVILNMRAINWSDYGLITINLNKIIWIQHEIFLRQ